MSTRNPNTLRIIGGRWKRRILPFPDYLELRPTPDRIRETLFNWLQPYINGARCLDLFAGSGALGFEALSRGAQHVTFVDKHPDAIKNIKEIASSLLVAEDDIDVVLASYPDKIRIPLTAPYDIIFIDPPFYFERYDQIVEWLDINHYLTAKALLYVEMERRREKFSMPGWKAYKESTTKNVDYFLIARNGVYDSTT